MASQVLSGTTTSLSYANNTGQNVRVVINYLSISGGLGQNLTAGNMTINIRSGTALGKNLAHTGSGNNIYTLFETSCPTEVMLSAGQVFSVSGSCTFNIVIIPEAG